MNSIKITFATLFAFIATFTFANNPYFVVEENEESYVMYLQIDNASDLVAVSVEGTFCVEGQTQSTSVVIAGADVEKFGNNMAQVHTLDKSCDFANYTVQITDANGDVWEYPTVLIQTDEYNLAMASK
ncbi:MAG: hypothetical protein ACPG4Z_05540 [Chitinophagales bacterium]